uniref:SRA1/Sec31 domain-containing protein n=1 Tax=Anopheles atroparvus TaxID=41427 RepID=A0A182J0E9_ANOAO
MSGENYRSASKSHEPGWNDPPKVAYVGPSAVAGSGGGSHPKATLNKRVAFPLQNRAPLATTQVGQPGNGQPPSNQPPLAPPSMVPPSAAKPTGGPQERVHEVGTEAPADREEMFREVRAALDGSIQRMEEGRREEIQKRINLIYESWTAGKLPGALEKHLHNLANALTETDAARASGIHRSIICDYGSKCALWAPALRQLIFTLPQHTEDRTEGNVIAKPI